MAAPANPLDGVEHLFSADRPATVFRAEYAGVPIEVSLRQMTASGDERFRSLLARSVGDPTGVDSDELHLELLDSTLVDFVLARRMPDGRTEQTPRGKDLDPAVRRQIFRDLSPEFRRKLVECCCEVNGFDPFLLRWELELVSSEPSSVSEKSSPEPDATTPATG